MRRPKLEQGDGKLVNFRQVATVDFPTRWATFQLLAFEASRTLEATGARRRETALALILGDLCKEPPLVRIHSQCVTGEVFQSLRCDCHDQLELALQCIGARGAGVVIYEQQEGRGIGLLEKLRAYELQDCGLDTVEANLSLGHAVDLRDYQLPVQILRHLKIRSVRLMSNNPDKITAVLAAGIQIAERVAADTLINPHAAKYAATKREKLGHLTQAVLDRPDADFAAAQPGRKVYDSRNYLAILSLNCAALGSGKQ
jgi:GTP cyclohydrolase II